MLVVDDDPAFLALAQRILEGVGIEVVATARDAAEATAAAHALRPDAALVDVGLPDRDGVALAWELVALPWRPQVVLTSTDRDAGSAIELTEPGHALPFVAKEELPTAPLRRLLAAR